MFVRVRGRYGAKQGGTAGYITCPGRNAGTGFFIISQLLFFGEIMNLYLLTKRWRRK